MKLYAILYYIWQKKIYFPLYFMFFFIFFSFIRKIFLGEPILIKKQTKYTNLKQNKGGGNRGKIGDYLLY